MRKEVGKKSMKTEVQNEVKKIRNKEEQVNRKRKKNKKQLTDDGSLRICLDPRDLKKAIKREHYQLATFDEIASRLTGATRFTKLDANKGYLQIPLDEQSSKLTTTNTPQGRYCFLQLPYGLRKMVYCERSISLEDQSRI